MIFKFYLHPALVPDLAFAKTQLVKYVADMNTILAKNTNRALEFNPETDIILTETKPHTDTHAGDLPLDFQIWAHAVKTEFVSHNGYYGIDQSGAGVLAGMRWNKIHNPDTGDITDYWRQIHLMLHELAHVFGAGMGELYNLLTVQDTTPAPSAAINYYNPSDPFWSSRPEWVTDPLTLNALPFVNPPTRAGLVNYAMYSPLTAHIISGNYRNGIPAPNPVIVSVRYGQTPLRNAQVKVWRVDCNSPYAAELVFDLLTDNDGQCQFAFGTNQRNSNSQLRYVKVYKGGYAAQAQAVTVHDADKATLLDMQDYLITFDLARQPSFADVPADHAAYAAIEAIAEAGITSGCGGGNFCPNSNLTRAQMAIWLAKGLGLV